MCCQEECCSCASIAARHLPNKVSHSFKTPTRTSRVRCTRAVTLTMHTHPCKSITHQVPGEVEGQDHDAEVELDLIQQLVEALKQEAEPPKARKQSPRGVRSYVNRLPNKLCGITSQESRFVTPELSSHSFRRGAAQHANADHHLSPHWILATGSCPR